MKEIRMNHTNAPLLLVLSRSDEPMPRNVIEGALLVQADTGKVFVYVSDTWRCLIASAPPAGGKAVSNVWVTAEGKLQVEYEDGL